MLKPGINVLEQFSISRKVAPIILRLIYACMAVHLLSLARLFGTSWTVAQQAPLSLGFSKQECWSGLPCLPPGDLPDPEIESRPPALQVASLLLSHQGSPRLLYIPHPISPIINILYHKSKFVIPKK